MKKILLICLGVGLGMACMAAGVCSKAVEGLSQKSSRVVRKVNLKNFDKIALAGSYDVVYTQGNGYSIQVVGPEKNVGQVAFEVNRGTLTIRPKRNLSSSFRFGFSKSTDDVVIKVTSPDLIAVTVTGSGSFKAPWLVDTDNLVLALTGSGDILFNNVVCDSYSAKLSGSGDMDIKKIVAQTANLTLMGSGDLDVRQYNVKKTTATLRGSGDLDIVCHDCGTLTADLIGSGDISLKGNVRNVVKNVRGSGDISDSTTRK